MLPGESDDESGLLLESSDERDEDHSPTRDALVGEPGEPW